MEYLQRFGHDYLERGESEKKLNYPLRCKAMKFASMYFNQKVGLLFLYVSAFFGNINVSTGKFRALMHKGKNWS